MPRDAFYGIPAGYREERLSHRELLKTAVIVASVFGAAASTSAFAQSTAETDAKCLVLTNMISRQPQDPKAQRALFAAHFYYLAPVHSEVSNDRLGTTLAEAAKSIIPGLAGKTFESCGSAVQTAESDVVQAAKAMQAQPKK